MAVNRLEILHSKSWASASLLKGGLTLTSFEWIETILAAVTIVVMAAPTVLSESRRRTREKKKGKRGERKQGE